VAWRSFKLPIFKNPVRHGIVVNGKKQIYWKLSKLRLLRRWWRLIGMSDCRLWRKIAEADELVNLSADLNGGLTVPNEAFRGGSSRSNNLTCGGSSIAGD
jgi:hypothetical protein